MFLVLLIVACLVFFLGLVVGITIGPEVHNMVVRATLEKASDEDRKKTLPSTPSDSGPLISDEGFWVAPPKPKRQNKRKRK